MAWIIDNVANGTKTVSIQFRDNALNESIVYSDTILYDTVAPTGSMTINSDVAQTNDFNTLLNIACSDAAPASGCFEMRIINGTDPTTEAWINVATGDIAWAIENATNGDKTVAMQFRDAALNESAIYSDVILYDTVVPTGSMTINSDDVETGDANVLLNISCSDAAPASGCFEMRVANGADPTGEAWIAYSDLDMAWLLDNIADGTKTVSACFTDAAANTAWSADTIILDTSPPSGSISIDLGAPFNTSGTSSLTFSAPSDTTDMAVVDGATVVTADIEASNGVIHVIDTVILPN